MKTMTQRQSRVAEEVRHILAPALLRGDVHSTLPLSRLTVTAVWVSPDLRLARVYLALPAGLDVPTTLSTADAELAAPLRKLLSKNLTGKTAPSISFHLTEEPL